MPLSAIKIQLFSVILVLFLALMPHFAHAQDPKAAFSNTGLPIPRFVSLASDKVFMRTGPGSKYPVTWEYQRKGLPVEITMEFDVWRKIKDSEGTEGWVHKSLLAGKRYGLVQAEDLVQVLRKPEEGARLMAYVQQDAVVALEECRKAWCKVTAQGYQGWMERKFIWGVYEGEEFD